MLWIVKAKKGSAPIVDQDPQSLVSRHWGWLAPQARSPAYEQRGLVRSIYENFPKGTTSELLTSRLEVTAIGSDLEAVKHISYGGQATAGRLNLSDCYVAARLLIAWEEPSPGIMWEG